MVEMSKKDFFKIEKAEPTEQDVAWRENFDAKLIRPYQRAFRNALETDNLYQLQYLLDVYPQKFKDLDMSLSEHYYISYHMMAMRDEKQLDILKTLLNETEFSESEHKRDVLEMALLSGQQSYAETVFAYFKDDVMHSKSTKNKLIASIVQAGRERSLALFLDAGVEVNDPTHDMLKKSVEHGRLNAVRMLVTEYDATITKGHISEAERLGQFEIATYLREEIENKNQPNNAVPKTSKQQGEKQNIVSDKPLSTWEVMGDDAIMHIRHNDAGTIKITDFYDFSQQNMMRSQYLLDQDLPPAVQQIKFSDLDGASSITKAFNQLTQKLGKEPKVTVTAKDKKEPVRGPQKLSLSKTKT